ncbi:MAG: response regulator, partial [Terriglobales bacterium]
MRVLVIEDEGRLADNVAHGLRENAGYAVDIAGDGEQGAFLAAANDYDLAIVDLMLPKLSGQELVQRWRAEGRELPVLILTA